MNADEWMKLTKADASDLKIYAATYWVTYAYCSKRMKTLEFNASGQYRVQRSDATTLYLGSSAQAAVEAYNE